VKPSDISDQESSPPSLSCSLNTSETEKRMFSVIPTQVGFTQKQIVRKQAGKAWK
jgi:hypothetical protein